MGGRAWRTRPSRLARARARCVRQSEHGTCMSGHSLCDLQPDTGHGCTHAQAELLGQAGRLQKQQAM